MKQFRLSDEGAILFQPDPTNPLAGTPVGRIRKGAILLQPQAEVTDGTIDTAKVTEWLALHINDVLQPLVLVKDEEVIQEPARKIADKVHDSLGILPRAELEGPLQLCATEGHEPDGYPRGRA